MIVFAKIIIVVKQLFFLAVDLIRVSQSLIPSDCAPIYAAGLLISMHVLLQKGFVHLF